MLTTNKHRVDQVYDCVKQFHKIEELPANLPSPQHACLIPVLRPYQVKAVNWMLYKELHSSFYQSYQATHSSQESQVLLPKGGILADEMGLGKTVEVLACILSNPRKDNCPQADFPQRSENCIETPIYPENVIGKIKQSDNLEVKEIYPTADGPSNESNELKAQHILETSQQNCTLNSDLKGIPETSTSQTLFNTENKWKRKQTPVKHSSKRKKTENSPDSSKHSNEILQSTYKRGPGENYKFLKSWYESCLSETSPSIRKKKQNKEKSSLKCCCVNNVSSAMIECPACNTLQHAKCVGYNDSATYQYYCFECCQNQPLVKSAGTVIISPEAISQQWASEIEKHVKENTFKVLVYEGVRVNGFIQPHDLASYDLVITTYQVLRRELNYAEPVVRNLRHTRKFYTPTSPLLCVEWWRLCLDEAQMVEGSSCKAAEMAKKLTAINKWAVTGTPIQKAVNDLVGLMLFLAGNEYTEFLMMVNRDWRSLLLLVPRVLWRTQKKDVLEEAGVPPQTEETHMLDFSKIEKYFYDITHNECSQQFLYCINKFKNLNVAVRSLDRKEFNKLLNPLLKLRQACIHPQVVRDKFLTVKKTMTMSDLVTQMVINARLDAEQALRQLVATLNGKGALHIIRLEWSKATDAYRAVLHLEQEHQSKLKIDSLQKIHCMHNLAEVLDGGYSNVAPTLRDSSLQEDIEALELRYLDKREAPIKVTEERLVQHSETIKQLMEEASTTTLGHSDWFLKMMECSSDREELLDRLKASIQHTDTHQKNQYNNLAKKLKSLYIVGMEVATWLAQLDETRVQVKEWLQKLLTANKNDLASKAQLCHLPQSSLVKKRTRCQLCLAESELKKYEGLLFEEKSKEERKSRKADLPGSANWEDNKDTDNKEIAELVGVNVNTFESSKKGGFKPSPFEKILKALATYGKHKFVSSRLNKEASSHLNLLDRVKKEFLDLNLMWRQIFDLIDAKDELNMCKTRLRLPYFEEEKEMENNKKAKDFHHIIAPYKVDPELERLNIEKKHFEELVKKKVGTLGYLKTVEKEGLAQTICPVCRGDLTEKWAVLQCGHCLCLECLQHLFKHATSLMCPQCRQSCTSNAVSFVETGSEPPCNLEVRGSYSTKVNGVVSHTLQLTRDQSNVKILVFSAWEKVLDLLEEAYKKNNVTFRRLVSINKTKRRQFINDFKTKDISVLLLPLAAGAKGLNLVEASHVFFVEPILTPAEELQAIGRVHRIGQTKPTVVHRFIVRESIEERILSAVTESAEQWSKDCLTLQQLVDLFSHKHNPDSSAVDARPGPSSVDNGAQ